MAQIAEPRAFGEHPARLRRSARRQPRAEEGRGERIGARRVENLERAGEGGALRRVESLGQCGEKASGLVCAECAFPHSKPREPGDELPQRRCGARTHGIEGFRQLRARDIGQGAVVGDGVDDACHLRCGMPARSGESGG
ncbi:hypothetical protein [Dermacoccus nishinomiyaensis]|uniref:hypothetical protein n=1 Tax=Dermacoccus nishinomiyaensis TaxID=1274 RepID=UPI0009DD110F|nr:hypothetical protein [Dermacoccus nishinomiyaensis]